MAEKDPNEKLLEQIMGILERIHEYHKGLKPEKKLPAGVGEQVDQLEKFMAIYKQITDEAFKSLGISPEEIQRKMGESKSNLPIEQQKFLEKAGKAERELSNLKFNYGIFREAIERSKGKSKKFGDSRKKKFKRLGGDDKGWMPL